eukprot:SAG22_NODE_1615_length_3986_cov_3.960895_5_plen_98_part_00
MRAEGGTAVLGRPFACSCHVLDLDKPFGERLFNLLFPLRLFLCRLRPNGEKAFVVGIGLSAAAPGSGCAQCLPNLAFQRSLLLLHATHKMRMHTRPV